MMKIAFDMKRAEMNSYPRLSPSQVILYIWERSEPCLAPSKPFVHSLSCYFFLRTLLFSLSLPSFSPSSILWLLICFISISLFLSFILYLSLPFYLLLSIPLQIHSFYVTQATYVRLVLSSWTYIAAACLLLQHFIFFPFLFPFCLKTFLAWQHIHSFFVIKSLVQITNFSFFEKFSSMTFVSCNEHIIHKLCFTHSNEGKWLRVE